MPKAKLQATVTTEVTTSLKMKPAAIQMLTVRAQEAGRLQREVKEAKRRLSIIAAEVESLFVKEKQGKALMEGADVNGNRFKMVTGVTRTLNKKKLVELGCEPQWLEEATDEKPKKAYVKITADGDDGEDDE